MKGIEEEGSQKKGWLSGILIKVILFLFFFGLSVGIGVGAGILIACINNLPSLDPLDYKGQDYWMLPSRVYSEDKELIGEFSKERRRLIKIAEVSKHTIAAFVATEDTSFFKHHGINIKGIIRAIVVNLASGRVKEGGSSITQQLAKNLFLTNEKTLKRKVQETLLALKIEQHYSKEEILERYLNKIYFGKGVYGIESASTLYFERPAKDLLLHQSAILAGIPKSPNDYSPFVNPNKATERGKLVLKRMVKERYISRVDLDMYCSLIDTEMKGMKERGKIAGVTINKAPYFIEYLRTTLERDYGHGLIYQGGLQIETTLDFKMQQAAEKALYSALERLNAGKKERIEGGLLAIDPRTGKIKAMVGGSGFCVKNQLNRTYQTKRQPGSSFKPIIYTAAFDSGFTLEDTIVDEDVSYTGADGKSWTPKNYGGKHYGTVTLRKALELSINIVSIKILEKLGTEKVIAYAHRLGIESALDPYLSLALGSSEVSLMELVTAYACFANSGMRLKPYGIQQIKDKKGAILEEAVPFYEPVLSLETAYLVNSALSGVITRGTAYPVLRGVFDRDIAGKTGTTNDYVDAWFIGYTPDLVCGVWVGYDKKRKSLGEKQTGCSVAAPIFREFMTEALKGLPKSSFPVPEHITVGTETDTGTITDEVEEVYPEEEGLEEPNKLNFKEEW
ncbi:penicillin-binding protein 1A [bacterium]|nr:penicillin-binding protein 1A [bacterium]